MMKPMPMALTFAALLSASVTVRASHAATPAVSIPSTAAAVATASSTAAKSTDNAVTLDTITATATLDKARNGLSPDTGSSQYVIDQHAIKQLPLGPSTPLNQVILQAPGVVQDSFGQMHVRGDHANLQYRINGVILPESISGFGQTLDARSIQSLRLLDGALPAQYGERTAAVVDIVTKNGHREDHAGNVGISGGSLHKINPHASVWGSAGRWSWFLTANYLRSDSGISNPTASRKPLHDHTNQLKTFADLTWLVNDSTRLSFMFGTANNRFEIPNNPYQQPEFGYHDLTDFDSATLNQRQRESTRFGTVSLQGKLGQTDYQVAFGLRDSGIHFVPDTVGDLMFDGVASRIHQVDRTRTLQADFATPLGYSNTVRYGLWYTDDNAGNSSHALVFPADSTGNQTSTTPFAIDIEGNINATTLAAYLQNEWFIGQHWTVNYGVRADRYMAFGTSASQLSPRLGVVWQATPETSIHASYARYFTPPATALISSHDITRFKDTTNAVKNYGDNTPLSERSDYYDVGIVQMISDHLTLGLDSYYRKISNLQDEGQFGAALIYATFNFAQGRVRGTEFTASYDNGPWSVNFNLAHSRALGKRVISSQYNFDADDLAYIYQHWIHLDHDQAWTSSGGAHYHLSSATTLGATYLYGSGLRKDGDVPNGATVPGYFQLNLSLSHDFDFNDVGKLHTQLALINAFDHRYILRDGSGIGVGAPQYGPRRGVFLSVSKDF